MSLTTLTTLTTCICKKNKILNINQLQGSPMYSKSNSTSFLVKKWSRWWSKNPTFRSSSHSFWSPIIHLRSLRFADSWLKLGENRCARCDFFHKVGQIRTNTDGHYFFVLIFAPSELNDAAELFPYWHLHISLVCLSAHKGNEGNLKVKRLIFQ